MRVFLLLLLITVSGVVSCGKQDSSRLDREKALANALVEKELYAQAVAEYGQLIHSGRLGLKEAAGISDRMANIYLDKLNDPENALVCLMRVREYVPGSELAKDAEKRMVECLERTGRYADARYEASRQTALAPKSGSESDPVLAQLEGRSLTRSQIERITGPLRGSREQNRQAVRSVLASELLAQSALRKGLDRKPVFADRLEDVRRSLLAEAVLNEHVENLSVDTSMADEYFAAHKERYVDSSATGKPRPVDFGTVRSRVIGDMANEKKQEMAGKLVEDLLRQADAKVFDDRIP